jgi:hypothetical protein
MRLCTLHSTLREGGSLGKFKMLSFANHLLLIFRRDPLYCLAIHFAGYTLSIFVIIRSAH